MSEKNLKDGFENDLELENLRRELRKSFDNYQKTLMYLSGDAPLAVLCLPPASENILSSHGCLRVYDLFNLDLTKVKGFGKVRIRELTTRLDQFFAML